MGEAPPAPPGPSLTLGVTAELVSSVILSRRSAAKNPPPNDENRSFAGDSSPSARLGMTPLRRISVTDVIVVQERRPLPAPHDRDEAGAPQGGHVHRLELARPGRVPLHLHLDHLAVAVHVGDEV